MKSANAVRFRPRDGQQFVPSRYESIIDKNDKNNDILCMITQATQDQVNDRRSIDSSRPGIFTV